MLRPLVVNTRAVPDEHFRLKPGYWCRRNLLPFSSRYVSLNVNDHMMGSTLVESQTGESAIVGLRWLLIFGQQDKLRAGRSKGLRRGRKEEAAQGGIQGASGDGIAFGGRRPWRSCRRSLGFIRR